MSTSKNTTVEQAASWTKNEINQLTKNFVMVGEYEFLTFYKAKLLENLKNLELEPDTINVFNNITIFTLSFSIEGSEFTISETKRDFSFVNWSKL